jgi:hypothetical protein
MTSRHHWVSRGSNQTTVRKKATHKPKREEPELSSLVAFIDKNQKLLTSLGIFTALTVFASNLQVKEVAPTLTIIFLLASTMLWIALWERVQLSLSDWLLTIFQLLIVLVIPIMYYIGIRVLIEMPAIRTPRIINIMLILMLLATILKSFVRGRVTKVEYWHGGWRSRLLFIVAFILSLAVVICVAYAIFRLFEYGDTLWIQYNPRTYLGPFISPLVGP